MSEHHVKERWPGRIALMVAHCAGMVDLVALPVWVGTLISRYGLKPQEAGALATLFLLGAVASSLYCAPRFHRLRGALVAPCGFALAAAAFLGVAHSDGYAGMAALHALAGAAAGAALSVTHGTIGRGARPHQTFALAGLALGVFAIAFLGATPHIVAAAGGPALFQVFAAVMLVAAVVCALAFPRGGPAVAGAAAPAAPVSGAVWFAALGLCCMGLVQAMMFSFLERIGADRGHAPSAVTGVLVALGLVNLLPAPLAALLERRWRAGTVVLCGPVIQAALAITIANSTGFAAYAFAGAVFAAVMIFTHTFAFGLIARLDPGGRALSATPAMLMTGAAIGPVLGGTLVGSAGYGVLGGAAAAIAAVAVFCFARAGRQPLPAAV
ncbi:MFS transporter [Pseudoduganella namucuonensis]|uniref:Predicted arabinose efflux permease, MFS family n=1 Tax=Pseudoduganella namucuonensis TaxID=1035707 RepID=A0A1I7LHT7_9BURK|nr:MFS transporter [Pseudoduganella namucuonensis]SFV09236.1 Predicted arabinose efflux permease, MFS family [Pseudoduganella namucuonensis]